jgi:hypothetical protein
MAPIGSTPGEGGAGALVGLGISLSDSQDKHKYHDAQPVDIIHDGIPSFFRFLDIESSMD